jgi:glycosyltransferase involved in cell wall biosynthesis
MPYTPKRVLIFSTDDHLYPAGGAEQAFGHITKRMPECEFDLICAKLRKGVKDYEQVGNVNIYRMGFGVPKLDGIILALFGQICAYKLMKQHTYDLVWSIMASYGAFAAVRVKKKTGLPLVLTLQEGDSFDYIYNKVKFVRRSFNEIFASADAIQAISHYLLNWGKEMGYTGPLGRVIPNGVEVESFMQQFDEETLREKRESFGFGPGACILITSSRLEKKNGVGDVIAALALLPKEVCFVICGSGSLEEGLRQKVEALGLRERVRFMGFVDPSELPLLMKASDIFIRPSLSEGLGNAFLEAMAAGLITVGTNAGGIPDFLADGKTGFIVGIEDPQSIADAIGRIRTLDDARIAEIKHTAMELVRTQYNWERVTSDMRTLFEEVVRV